MNSTAIKIANDLIFKLRNSIFSGSKDPRDYAVTNVTKKGLMISVFGWGDFIPYENDYRLRDESSEELEDIINSIEFKHDYEIKYTDDAADNIIIDVYLK
jgi:hypothetical protein